MCVCIHVMYIYILDIFDVYFLYLRLVVVDLGCCGCCESPSALVSAPLCWCHSTCWLFTYCCCYAWEDICERDSSGFTERKTVTYSFTYTKQNKWTGLTNLHLSVNILPCFFFNQSYIWFCLFCSLFLSECSDKNNFHPVLMGLVQTSNTRALPAHPQEHCFTL